MQGETLMQRPKRRWHGKAQWVVTLDTGRFGDWVVIETDDSATEDDVRKKLTRAQRTKALSIKKTIRTGGGDTWEEADDLRGTPTSKTGKTRRSRG